MDDYRENLQYVSEDILISLIRENKDVFKGYEQFQYLLEMSKKQTLYNLIHGVRAFYKLPENLIFAEESDVINKAKEYQEYFLKELRELDKV